MKKSTSKKVKVGLGLFDIVIMIVLIVFALLTIYNPSYFEQIMNQGIQHYGLIALFIVNFFLELIPQFITPVVTLAPALIIGFNTYLTILVVVFGSLLGSLLGYEIGKKYGCDLVCNLMTKKNMDRTMKFMNKYGRIAMFIAAISPLPYIPIIMGSLKMTRRNFFIFGIIPRAVALILIGYWIHFGVF